MTATPSGRRIHDPERRAEAVKRVGEKACEVAGRVYGGTWHVEPDELKVAKKDIMFIVSENAKITVRTDFEMMTPGKQTWLISIECEGENADHDLVNLRARIAALLAP